MLNFTTVDISHKNDFDKYIIASGINRCEYSFVNLYCWSWYYKTQICFVNGFMLIRYYVNSNDDIAYIQPLGNGNIDEIIGMIIEDTKKLNIPLKMYSLSKEFAERVVAYDPDKYQMSDSGDDRADYLYLTEKLQTLSGKKLQSKRNHINKFKNTINYRFEEIEKENKPMVLEILTKWQEEKGVEKNTVSDEEPFITRALDNMEELGVKGGVLYVDEKPIAFTIASPINDNTYDIHIEKSYINIDGAFQMINYLFANTLPEEYIYINREEDLGIEGLRKAKQSYYPVEILRKYQIKEK